MESKRQQKIREAITIIGNVSPDEWREFWDLAGEDKERMCSILKSAYTEINNDVRDEEIKKILNEMGFAVKNNGYQYLIMAIGLYMDNSTLYSPIWKLYEEISEHFGKSAVAVERCIRWEIQTAWARMSYSQKDEIFNQTIKKPTNKEFIKFMIQMLE